VCLGYSTCSGKPAVCISPACDLLSWLCHGSKNHAHRGVAPSHWKPCTRRVIIPLTTNHAPTNPIQKTLQAYLASESEDSEAEEAQQAKYRALLTTGTETGGNSRRGGKGWGASGGDGAESGSEVQCELNEKVTNDKSIFRASRLRPPLPGVSKLFFARTLVDISFQTGASFLSVCEVCGQCCQRYLLFTCMSNTWCSEPRRRQGTQTGHSAAHSPGTLRIHLRVLSALSPYCQLSAHSVCFRPYPQSGQLKPDREMEMEPTR